MSVLFKTAVRDLTRHPGQALLAMVGVALGVALGVSVDLANQSVFQAFERAATSVEASATHELTAGSEGVPTVWLARLDGTPGVRKAVPIVELIATEGDPNGPPVRILGIDPLAAEVFAGNSGSEPLLPLGLERFLSQPVAFVSETFAQQRQLAVGESLRVVAAGRAVRLEVGGLFTALNAASSGAFTDTVLVDIATGQELLGRPDRVSRIELELEEGTEAQLAAQLPPDLVLQSRGERVAELDRMTRAFRLNLQALSWLALLCGLFLLFQALHLTAVRRREELARLRALGATQRQLLVAGWLQVAGLGTLGTGLGLLVGIGLAQGMTRLVLGTVRDLYFEVAVGGPVVEFPALFRGGLAGLLGAALAAALPIWQAARTDPRLALARIGLEGTVRRWLPWGAILGLIGLGIGLVLIHLPQIGLGLTFLGLFFFLLGSAAVLPWILARTSRQLAQLETLPVVWKATARAVAAGLSRTGPAVVALALAGSVGIAVVVSIESLRQEVVAWLGEILPGDLYVSPPARPGMEALAQVPAELTNALAELAGISSVEQLRIVHLARPGKLSIRLLGVRADSPNLRAQRLVAGRLEDALPAFRIGKGVIVSEPLARREGLGVGSRWSLPLAGAWTEFEVVAVHADFATDQGAVLLDLGALERALGPGAPSAVAIFAVPGQGGRQALLKAQDLARSAGMIVQTSRQLREESLRLFDRTFRVAHTLRWLTLLVAALGVASGLAALELERGRELAILVAVGIGPQARQRFVFLEAMWIGGVSVAASVPLGALLAYGLLEGINRKSFGWTVSLSLEGGPILVTGVATLLAAAIAAWLPAWQAARLDPVSHLRAE